MTIPTEVIWLLIGNLMAILIVIIAKKIIFWDNNQAKDNQQEIIKLQQIIKDLEKQKKDNEAFKKDINLNIKRIIYLPSYDILKKSKTKYVYIIVFISYLSLMTSLLGYYCCYYRYNSPIQETFIIPLHNPQRRYELYYDGVYQTTNPNPQDIYAVILKEQLKNCDIRYVSGTTK
ncbi:MAG: hypothetical protein WJU30_00520 [Candidatus Phytoplasma pruni]